MLFCSKVIEEKPLGKGGGGGLKEDFIYNDYSLSAEEFI